MRRGYLVVMGYQHDDAVRWADHEHCDAPDRYPLGRLEVRLVVDYASGNLLVQRGSSVTVAETEIAAYGLAA